MTWSVPRVVGWVEWGAEGIRTRLGLTRGLVQVLNPRRNLDKFSPQQLAAIAWSYAMVKFDAPQLFDAVHNEAMRKPQLAEMLNRAGLLRHPGSQMVYAGVGGGGHANMQGRPSSANHAMGGLGQASAGGQMQGMGGGMGGMGNNGAHGMGYPASQAGAGHVHQQGQHGQQGFSGQAPSNNNKGPGYSQQQGYTQSDAGNGQSAQGASKGSEVARAAEEHKKEMEEKQRQVIGCEEGDACPLCVEEMDATDLALMPCPCGYQVCLLCLNKIRNEGNKQCPACRTEYVLYLHTPPTRYPHVEPPLRAVHLI